MIIGKVWITHMLAGCRDRLVEQLKAYLASKLG